MELYQESKTHVVRVLNFFKSETKFKAMFIIQCLPLFRINSGQHKSDNKRRILLSMIQLSGGYSIKKL